MSRLTVYSDQDPSRVLLDTDDGEAIRIALAEVGVLF